jgi:Cdc6-like AAA superfamily ATPase
MDEALKLKKEDSNEANTRLQIIDEALELLGWAKADFNPESRTQVGDYTDYLLKSHHHPLIVVEAKRVGTTFSLPQENRRMEYKASFLCLAGGNELKEAMAQAADYCNQNGCLYAVVTNGWQWIIFRGLAIKQKGWTAFPAVVFNDPQVLKDNFIEFWNLLSKQKVLQGSLNEKFAEERLPLPEFAACPNSNLTDKPTLININRNNLECVDILFDYYFDDIISADKGIMLKECFVEDPDTHEFQKELQLILRERLLSLQEEIESEELTSQGLIKYVEEPKPGNKAKVVLIVGRVGAGKTTFLHKFFKTLESERRYAKFILDLISQVSSIGNLKADEEERLSRLILEHISNHYYKKENFGAEFDPYDGKTLRTIYGSKIKQLERGPKKLIYERDKELFEKDVADLLDQLSKDVVDLLPKYMQYITRRKKTPFCLIIDNVDRASDQYQKFIYTFAHKLSRSVEGIIVISLRETTYQYARQKGFLDTRINDKVFQLNPANLKTVISKRLKYLKYHIANPKTAWPEIRSYLDKLKKSGEHLRELLLLEDDSARLLITCIANRSIRNALQLLKQYATSAFAANEWEKGEAGKHVLRALMLTKFVIYQEINSPIVNLFAVRKDIRGSHLLLLRLLIYLNWCHHGGTRLTDSPKIEQVVSVFEEWGIQKSIVMQALKDLVWNGLVESDSRYISDDQQIEDVQSLEYENTVRISPAGYFYINKLAQDKLYHVYCAGDTTWYSEEYYKKFAEEYSTFVELACSEPGLDNLVNDSNCYQHWISYLRIEKVQEESLLLGNSDDIAWRSAIIGVLNNLIPLDMTNQSVNLPTVSKSSKSSKRVTKQKNDENQLSLLDFLEEESSDTDEAKSKCENNDKDTNKGEDEDEALLIIINKMPKLPENKSYKGAKYLPRVLWVLEIARQAKINDLSASKMAELINKYGLVQVEPTNIAKFLRNNKKAENFQDLWIENSFGKQHFYEISKEGQELYEKLFNCSNSESNGS